MGSGGGGGGARELGGAWEEDPFRRRRERFLPRPETGLEEEAASAEGWPTADDAAAAPAASSSCGMAVASTTASAVARSLMTLRPSPSSSSPCPSWPGALAEALLAFCTSPRFPESKSAKKWNPPTRKPEEDEEDWGRLILEGGQGREEGLLDFSFLRGPFWEHFFTITQSITLVNFI